MDVNEMFAALETLRLEKHIMWSEISEMIGQDGLEAFSVQREIRLRERIKEETRKKYEEELKAYKEENKKLKELLVNAYEWKRKVITERVAALKKDMEGKNDSEDDGTEVAEKLDDLELEDVDLPLLLRPEFEEPLRLLASQMTPETFVCFIRSCKKLYNMAEKGILKVPLTLACRTYKQGEVYSEGLEDDERDGGDSDTESERDDEEISYGKDYKTDTLVLKYNKRPLGYTEVLSLHKNKWIVPELKCLAIDEFNHADVKALDLLDFLGVKKIYWLETVGEVEAEEFLKKCDVSVLYCAEMMSSSLLSSPHIHKLKEIMLDLSNLRLTNDDIMKFLVSSPIPSIKILSCSPMLPTSFSDELVDKWLAGETHFKKISFPSSPQEGEQVLAGLLKKSAIRLVSNSLSKVSTDDVYDILTPAEPMVICGSSNSFVVIRDDLKMLNVCYRNNLYRDQCVEMAVIED